MKINRLIIVPLSAAAFLVGCKPSEPSTVTAKLTFGVKGTTLSYGDKTYEPSDKPIEIQIPSGVTTNYVKFAINADETEVKKPSALEINKTGGDAYSDYVFNKDTGELIVNLNSDLTISCKEEDYSYKTLNELTWAQISAISAKGEASRAFTIGDTKDIYLLEKDEKQNFPHKVRIIDFDHDTYNVSSSETKDISITFEFVNVITLNNGQPLKTNWDATNNFDFAKSELNAYLNSGTFYGMIPEDLKAELKTANKAYAKSTNSGSSYTISTYQAKFFPLSCYEMWDGKEGTQSHSFLSGDGKAYWYYERDYEKVQSLLRTKTPVNSSDNQSYWIRSPRNSGGSTYAGRVYGGISQVTDGIIYDNGSVENSECISPAFVI